MDAEKLLGNTSERERLEKETVDKGGALALLYFDLHAANKDTLQQLGAALVQKLLQEKGVVYAIGEIDEPLENEGLFSSPVEVRVLAKNFSSLARICGNYSPFSLELLKPEEIRLPVDKAHELLMDIAINNYELKKLIIEKVYSKEDMEKFRKNLEGRLAMGKKLLENKGDSAKQGVKK